MKRLLLTVLLGIALQAGAQVVGGNVSADDNGTFKLKGQASQLVVESVTVKDKSGNPVKNLAVKDFTLTEDGVAQKIAFAEYQELPVAKDATPIGPPTNEDLKLYNKLLGTQIAPEPAGDSRYHNKRLMAFYFDMTAMGPVEQQRALTATMDFIRKSMTPVDRVAIFRYAGGSVDVLVDFTDDRNKLLSVLSTMSIGEGQGNDEEASDAGSSDTGAAFGQDSGEFNIFNTDRQLAALQTAVQMLGVLNEKKTLSYFANGIRQNGLDNIAQMHATIDAAIRAGVSFWPIDARGLVATGPLGDASRGSQGGSSMYTGSASLAVTTSLQNSQDTLYGLAADTGGKALLDSNDLSRGLINAQDSVASYYIVGYYPTNTNLDGKFRKIKISVDPTVANLEYRQGYYAGKVWAKFNANDKERQLEEALMQADPWTELTISMEINYFQINGAEYFVPIMVKIPGKELALAKQHGAERTLIDFIGEIKDDYGNTTVTNLRDNVNAALTDATVAELAKRPIEYRTGYTMLPGKYTIKFLARDNETGRIGTFQTSFVIPNLTKEDKRIPTSTVVLSSEKQDLRGAIFNAQKSKEAEKNNAANPLYQDGKEMIPSVTRVFSKTRPMYVYLQAYEQESGAGTVATTRPVLGYVAFYKDGQKVFETQPVEVATAMSVRLQTMPLSFDISLADLPPGKYDCQVSVLDPGGQKASFWSAPVLIVQ